MALMPMTIKGVPPMCSFSYSRYRRTLSNPSITGICKGWCREGGMRLQLG